MLRVRSLTTFLLGFVLGSAIDADLLAQAQGPATPARQETFSPQEREVWAQEETFWETIKAQDLKRHMALYDENISTYVSRTVRNGKDQWTAARARQFSQRRTGEYTYRIRPLSVRVYGDTGVAIYHAQTSWADAEGKPQSYNQTIMHVHRKTPDGWKIIAGTILPPPADAP